MLVQLKNVKFYFKKQSLLKFSVKVENPLLEFSPKLHGHIIYYEDSNNLCYRCLGKFSGLWWYLEILYLNFLSIKPNSYSTISYFPTPPLFFLTFFPQVQRSFPSFPFFSQSDPPFPLKSTIFG